MAGAIVGGACKCFSQRYSVDFNVLPQSNLLLSNGRARLVAYRFLLNTLTSYRAPWQLRLHSLVGILSKYVG